MPQQINLTPEVRRITDLDESEDARVQRAFDNHAELRRCPLHYDEIKA